MTLMRDGFASARPLTPALSPGFGGEGEKLVVGDCTQFVARLAERMRRYPARIAIQSRGTSLTYGELLERASALRHALVAQGVRAGDRVALLGSREVADYVGLLAILLAGCAYVPLSAKFPAERNRDILEQSGAVGILADAQNSPLLAELAGVPARFALCSDSGETLAWPSAGKGDLGCEVFEDGIYIIFTSGTTGKPKGVPITGTNLGAYLANLESLFRITPQDKVAQLSELTFDASVHEIFIAWNNGAALCAIPQSSALLAARHVEEEGITVWLSVPSTISLAHRAGTLKPGSMRSLRIGCLGGEALSLVTARHFAAAAPKAEIVNLWGPTEGTVSLSTFQVDLSKALPDIIPIGRAHADQTLALIDGDGRPVAAGEIGELMASGSQVTRGYWRSPELDAQKFIERDGQRWYRTGDLAKWDDRYGYCYLGRVDRQVKVKGHRVELQDCESALGRLVKQDLVRVVPWPKAENGAALGLVGFVYGAPDDPARHESTLRESLKGALPSYMIPERIVFLEHFPFNANGKVDYKALERDAERLLRS